MVKKIVLLGVFLVVGLGLFGGCRNNRVFSSEDFSLVIEVNGFAVNAGDTIEVTAILSNISERDLRVYFLLPNGINDTNNAIDLGIRPTGIWPETGPVPTWTLVRARLGSGEALTRTIKHQFVEILQGSDGEPFCGNYSVLNEVRLFASRNSEPLVLRIAPITIRAV